MLARSHDFISMSRVLTLVAASFVGDPFLLCSKLEERGHKSKETGEAGVLQSDDDGDCYIQEEYISCVKKQVLCIIYHLCISDVYYLSFVNRSSIT